VCSLSETTSSTLEVAEGRETDTRKSNHMDESCHGLTSRESRGRNNRQAGSGLPGKAGLGNHVFNPNICILRLYSEGRCTSTSETKSRLSDCWEFVILNYN
jgi:hypothetical protein